MDENLVRLGLIDEEDISLDEAALSLALLDQPTTDLTPYTEVIDALVTRLSIVGRAATTAQQRADTLSEVLGGEFGFIGDRETYDDPANADLIRVIELSMAE